MSAQCENDEYDVAGPGESLCRGCLDHERRGVGLTNYRRRDRQPGRATVFDLDDQLREAFR